MEENKLKTIEGELEAPADFTSPDVLYRDLVASIRKYHPSDDLSMIEKAYQLADNAHKDQKRKSGEPYIIHPLCVAIILADLEMDKETIAAGLLHDVVEDTVYTEEQLAEIFGKEVALLVDGVTKLTQLSWSADKVEMQAENLRKMFLAMAKDIRVIIIKLADRLHNMRTLQYMRPEKQKEKARETIEIYSPLADRLGISKIKIELDDLALRYLEPNVYKELEEKIALTSEARQKFIDDIIAEIKTHMENAEIRCEVNGRVKHFFSIYKKMLNQHKTLDQIYDIFAVRIIVDSVKDCYAALGVIHEMYKPIPGRFKDYIAMPKPNMYQSLHTTLIGTNGQPFEIQIRTFEMHRTAEYGIAAHWKYKEGVRGSSKDDQRLAWIRQIIESQQESNDVEEIVRAIKNDLAPEDVFAFTPKGDMITLPVGSTVIDFAYAIHTQVGHKMCGAKVDKKMVSYDYQIKTGEIIEILTTNVEGHGPSRSWLNICKTNEAKSKIRSWFKKERREENIFEGRNALEREFRRNNIRVPEEELEDFLKMDMHRHSCDTLDDFFAAIGYGGVQLSKVMQRLKSEYNKKYGEKAQPDTSDLENKIKTSKNSTGVIVDGIDNCAIKFAQCCNPLPGDEIVGFITRGHGISVHKKDCVNYLSQKDDPENAARWINVKWESSEKHTGYFKCTLDIVAVDRIGLLADVSSALAMINIFIYESTSRELKNGNAMLSVTVSIAGMEQLNNVINKLQKIKNVISVERSGK